jgi:phage-related minor tail protein
MSVKTFLGKVFGDVEKVVEAPVSAAEKLITVINEVKTDVPELKAALAGLFAKLEAVGKDAAEDTSVAGVMANGIQTVKDAVAAVSYFNSVVLPLVEQIYGQVKTDVGSAPVPAAPAAPALTAAVPLHEQTPA